MVAGAVVDAAIGWLVQRILGNLCTEKLEAWTRGGELADDVEKLKSAVRHVEVVVVAAKERKIENGPLVLSLGDLKELLYDAEDVMDELDYYRLQEQATSGNTGGGTASAALVAAHSTATSSTWFSSCTQQVGRTLIDNFCIFISTGESRGKRKREDDHDIAANIHLGRNKKNEFSRRIQHIAGKLRDAGNYVSDGLKIHPSNFIAISKRIQDTRLTSSYIVEHKVYGRDAEMESILQLMTSNRSNNSITVLPIVGIGGVGKTTLAQLVYNDPIVANQFQIKIWVCVSDNFDVLRLTREMLDYVSKQRQAETGSLNKLQEDLEKHMESHRFLIVLDDVWDDMKEHSWSKLLAPLKRNQAMGNMILVTTRKLPALEMTRTVEPIKLGALEGDDFWLLFKACAFGDGKHEDDSSRLCTIGKGIAQELRGNPLAAKTVGALLKRNISIDNWTNILNSEEWKSLEESGGIMSALKLSYDYLPDHHLQQCFRYCCLFPKDYHFDGEELIRIWISQGFVDHSHADKKLEDRGKVYLAYLVNSGFFQQVQRNQHSPDFMQGGYPEGLFVMHDLMHDLACEVSRAEFATIDGSDFGDIRPTIRHLSLVTSSADRRNDQHGNAFSRGNFDKKLKKVTSVKKLRSLVLIGYYDQTFFEDFQHMFKEAESLRLLQISATYANFVSFLRNLEYRTHLRYLKLESKVSSEALPIPLNKFYHLEVLDAGRPARVHGMNDLVNMRCLVVTKGTSSSVTSAGDMSDHQDVQNFTDQNSSSFEITQLQSMNKLVQLGMYLVENVNITEAYGAKLREKQNLEKLHLSWKDTSSQGGYASDTKVEYESLSVDDNDPGSEHFSDTEAEEEHRPMDDSGPGSEPSSDTEAEEESLQMNDTDNSPTSEHFVDTAKQVLEGLEPHHDVKHLQITGYSGAASPAWLATSVTCLQTLHLEDCGEWKILPSLEKLPFLTKLKLRNMQKVKEVSIPSLEGLVLIQMPKLERCSCKSVRDLNSSLRVLKIEGCYELKSFPLFESCEKLKIEKSWLSRLSELTIHDCPHLTVSHPLPSSSSIGKLSIARVSTLPTMEGSSNGKLTIGVDHSYEEIPFDENSDGLTNLDDKILSFHNLRARTRLEINGCQNLSSISLKDFRQLISLKSLEICCCQELFSSDVLLEDTYEDMAAADCKALPFLKHLRIRFCGIAGKWLSVMLQHVLALEELYLEECEQITWLSIQEKESSLSHLTSTPAASSSGFPNDTLISSDSKGLLCIPSNLILSMKMIHIQSCENLRFLGRTEGFSGFTSLEELHIMCCPDLISSFVLLKKPESCFPGNLTRLKELGIGDGPDLKSLQVDSCTQLEMLMIQNCTSLAEVEGLQSLGRLKHLVSHDSPGLLWKLEALSRQGYALCPLLETLYIDDYSFLATSFCRHLTSLQSLTLQPFTSEVTRLTDEQESVLLLLPTLQELRFRNFYELTDLPVGLHSLPSLKRLQIHDCPYISRLPERGLPPSLEKLEISSCSEELIMQCRMLATSKLKVKISRGM